MGDMSCATMEGTFRAAYASAQTAIAGAEEVLAGARAAFSLCRPPGHHAYADRCSGFCYLNNAAIAAEVLRRKFQRVAIIDFDTHHGDGTQAIFYDRADVFYGSVHTDPSAYYPHFAGYADETGAGAGEGANLNLPLPFGADDAAFIAANARLCEAVTAHRSEALVLSAGWDAHRDDPLSKLAVSTDAYARIGELYGKARPADADRAGGRLLAHRHRRRLARLRRRVSRGARIALDRRAGLNSLTPRPSAFRAGEPNRHPPPSGSPPCSTAAGNRSRALSRRPCSPAAGCWRRSIWASPSASASYSSSSCRSCSIWLWARSRAASPMPSSAC